MSWTVDGLAYDKRKKITIDNANVGATLTDFPVLVKFTNDADIGAVSNADGFDHRFTTSDGTALCKYERETFSITGGNATGIYWVKVPSVSTSADTDIYLYYRSTDTADGADAANVWDANFKAVYHFGNGTTLSLADSTSNGVTLTNNSATAGAGVFGAGSITCASGLYAYATDPAVLDFGTGSFTISSFAKMTTRQSQAQVICGKGIIGEAGWQHNVYYTSFDYQYWFRTRDASVAVDNRKTSSPTALSENVWYHLSNSSDRSATNLSTSYINGVLYATSDLSGVTGTTSNARDFFVGRRSDDAARYWIGLIDELRLSASVRDTHWNKFEYYNMSSADNELTFGSEETASSAAVFMSMTNWWGPL